MAQENEELKDKCNKCEEYLNGWKRERADFINYKKEEMEKLGQLVKYANQELILKILPILDNFCLAEKHIIDPGFLQIKKQLEDLLAKEGIEPINVLGKPFDPAIMESVGAASQGEASLAPEGRETVSEEVQRGYTLHGKLLRPARVKISK